MSQSARVQLWNIFLLVRGSARICRQNLSFPAHLGDRCIGLEVLLYRHCKSHRLMPRLNLERMSNVNATQQRTLSCSLRYQNIHHTRWLFTTKHVLNPVQLLLPSNKDEFYSFEGLFRGYYDGHLNPGFRTGWPLMIPYSLSYSVILWFISHCISLDLQFLHIEWIYSFKH